MEFFDIQTNYPIPHGQKDFFCEYIEYLKKLIRSATPEEIYRLPPNPTKEDLLLAYQRFEASTPIIHYSEADEAPCSLSVTIIAGGYFTWGLGRFAGDILNRWLIPGKQVPLLVSQGLNFSFKRYSHFNYYCHNVVVKVVDQQELEIIKENFTHLIKEMRLVIKATIHARRIITTAALPLEQKHAFIQDYLMTLINRPAKEFDQTVFDQVHQVVVHASAEHNISRIKSNFAKLAHKAPHMLDRDIFNEIQHYVILFRDKFISTRTQFHLYRIISYMYIFRKWVVHQIQIRPNDRHVSLKLIPAKIEGGKSKRTVLGIVIGMNFLLDNEAFGARHILASIRTHLPEVQEVKESYVVDNRKSIDVLTHYMEVEKNNGSPFSIQEIRLLKNKLVKELPSRIERSTHPLFVHRNEEEIMRNILILSRQLKYVNDIPQVIVNYAKQTTSSLSFTVILLRLLKPGSKPLQKDHGDLKFIEYDAKIVGHLRRKYPKEANVFEIRVDKHLFLRHDYSIDLYKARETVIKQLVNIVGELRDFNGGMISKQSEALLELKNLLKKRNITNDFLLENFFYSITPTFMQSVIAPEHLERLFLMLLELTEGNFNDIPYHFQSAIEDEMCYIAIGAPQAKYQETVSNAIESLQIPGSELCATTVNIFNISVLCYLLRSNDPSQAELLISTAKRALQLWSEKLTMAKDTPLQKPSLNQLISA